MLHPVERCSAQACIGAAGIGVASPGPAPRRGAPFPDLSSRTCPSGRNPFVFGRSWPVPGNAETPECRQFTRLFRVLPAGPLGVLSGFLPAGVTAREAGLRTKTEAGVQTPVATNLHFPCLVIRFLRRSVIFSSSAADIFSNTETAVRTRPMRTKRARVSLCGRRIHARRPPGAIETLRRKNENRKKGAICNSLTTGNLPTSIVHSSDFITRNELKFRGWLHQGASWQRAGLSVLPV